MTCRLIIVMALAMLAAGSAHAATVTVTEPRGFGYFLGDTIRRDVIIRTAPGETLDPGSLPRPGPVNYWLELGSANLTEERNGDEQGVYRLALTYQTFYAPLDPRKLTIPAFKLKVDTPSGVQELLVPEFGFLTSPIRQLFASQSDKGAATELQPDHVGSGLGTGAERTALLISGLIALASLLALARHNAWWPFQRRPQRPFTQAARYLRSNARRLQGGPGYRNALLKLHRAFDLSAGRRVLSEDVDTFLQAHPQFAPLQADVERLFASSRQAFFANDVERARAAMPLEAVTALGEQLGAAERRAA